MEHKIYNVESVINFSDLFAYVEDSNTILTKDMIFHELLTLFSKSINCGIVYVAGDWDKNIGDSTCDAPTPNLHIASSVNIKHNDLIVPLIVKNPEDLDDDKMIQHIYQNVYAIMCNIHVYFKSVAELIYLRSNNRLDILTYFNANYQNIGNEVMNGDNVNLLCRILDLINPLFEYENYNRRPLKSSFLYNKMLDPFIYNISPQILYSNIDCNNIDHIIHMIDNSLIQNTSGDILEDNQLNNKVMLYTHINEILSKVFEKKDADISLKEYSLGFKLFSGSNCLIKSKYIEIEYFNEKYLTARVPVIYEVYMKNKYNKKIKSKRVYAGEWV